jgi:protein-L-isoaspartate O-methyltransferase
VLWRWRNTASQRLLWALCAATHRFLGGPPNGGTYTTRVLGGPLRGQLLTMPSLIRAAYALGTYEPRIVRTMGRHVARGMVVYDVGSHVGYLTLVLAGLVGGTGQVFAFEADPTNRTVLQQNVARN